MLLRATSKEPTVSIIASRRSSSRVVYHCPACFADRVGIVGRGRWNSYPDDRACRGTYFECTACGTQVGPCRVKDSPTAEEFGTRLFRGTRSLIASVLVAGEIDEATRAAAIDAVEVFTPLPYRPEMLDEDLAARDLDVQLRGDLILLAEQLKPHGCEALLTHASRIASIGAGPTDEQKRIVAQASGYLGCPGFDPGWEPLERLATRGRKRRSARRRARV
jgi:hypothetical protein